MQQSTYSLCHVFRHRIWTALDLNIIVPSVFRFHEVGAFDASTFRKDFGNILKRCAKRGNGSPFQALLDQPAHNGFRI